MDPMGIFLMKSLSLDFRQEIEELLTESISSHAGHRSSEMIKLCIDQIEAAGSPMIYQ